MQEAVQSATQNHPKVLEASSNYRMEAARLRQSVGRYSPTVDLAAAIGPQYVDKPNSLSVDENREWKTKRQADLTASLVLFNGFKRANDVYSRIASLNASSYAVLDETEQTALAATEAYLDVIRHRNILLIAKNNVDIHRSYLSQITSSFENGGATGGDVAQARERLRAAEKVIADVRQAVGLADAKYESIVGIAPQRLTAPAYPKTLPNSVGQAIAKARASHPALKSSEMAVEQAEFERKRARSDYYPTLSLDGSASVGEDVGGTSGLNNEYFVGVRVAWNLFDGGIKNARERERVEEVSARKHQLDQIRRDVDLAVRDAWVKKVTVDEQASDLRAQLAEADRMVAAFKREYEAGTRSYFDLMTAESNRFNVRIELTSTQSIAHYSRYQLLAATGKLLSYFNVQPPEQHQLLQQPNNPLGFALSNGLYLKPLD
ncbi:TolC family outer membrane protein [Roseibium denhamense]|uniref:TolC family outer membrane protein n=1 Tax=Roseibium denhamense TaxID=76305 RepID=UPI0018AD2560|nr:TolC family outer membrane protein [Roseibium denhamense]